MISRSLVPVVLTCCLFAACDGQDALESPCLPEPLPGESNYFPLSKGQTWTFDYEQVNIIACPGCDNRVVGTLSWRVTSTSACNAGQQRYDIEETFSGEKQVKVANGPNIDEWPWEAIDQVRWTKPFSIAVGDSIELGPYFGKPVPWMQPASSPDTLVFSQDLGPESVTIKLVRGVGLVYWFRFKHHGLTADEVQEMVLREKEEP